MVFWIAIAVLTAAVTYAVTRPLLVQQSEPAGDVPSDLEVYKDQLSEIDADAARGLISGADADAARTEVSRRVLRQAETAAPVAQKTGSSALLKPVYLATTAVLPLASLALYITFGAPGMPGVPLSERLAAPVDSSRPDELIAKVEARLRDHPEDGKGWDVVAPVYMASGRFPDAAEAYAKAMKYLGETPQRLQGFANARIRSENGIVPDDARKALQTILAGDPKLKEPRVWLALAKEQDGKPMDAANDYRALIAEAPEGAPWKQLLQDRLDKLDGKLPAPPKGPDAASVAAVEAMSPAGKQAFVTRMVDGLAERMKTDLKDKDGWMKLIRAYQMMGRKDDAAKALANAKAGLQGDATALSEIDALAKQLGVGG